MQTETTPSNLLRTFKDLDLSFNIHPIKKDINKHTAERAIINSVKNLLLTNHFERPFQPFLGSNIRSLLFEPMDGIIAKAIDTEIRNTLRNFEPRVEMVDLVVVADYDNNGFNVTLTVRPINLSNSIQINFFLERVR